jgi:hypothetical protein
MKPAAERRQIEQALARWFQSQSIGLSDAVIVMGTMIANITAEISESKSDMEEGIKQFLIGFENVAEETKNAKYSERSKRER